MPDPAQPDHPAAAPNPIEALIDRRWRQLVLLFWLSRMVMITHRGWMHDDPVVFAARDYISIVCLLLIFLFALGGVML